MIDEIWPAVFSYLQKNKDKIWVTTHSEYIKWLNGRE